MTILDQFGQPISTRNLTRSRERLLEATTNVRPTEFDSVARGVKPSRIASVLRDGDSGDVEAQLTLAEEMEDRYLHYFGVLNTRKLSVSGAPVVVQPADDSDRAKEIAEAFEQAVVKKPAFGDLLFDLMDGVAKGFAVVEPVWNTTTRPWVYEDFVFQEPRWFQWDKRTKRDLRHKVPASDTGRPLEPGRFVVHMPRIRSALPIKQGLARIAAFGFMAQTFTVRDWLAFMEVYGMPVRLGRYDPETITEDEKETLRSALAGLGHDAAAMIPKSMELEFVDVKRPSGGDSLFGGLADYWDKQISKGVLGQTMTTDDGASLSQAKVHESVRQDIRKSDARQLGATVNRGVTRPWVQLNFGESAPVPRVIIDVSEPEDLVSFTKATLPWVTQGKLRVGAQYVRERLGIPDPEEGLEILGGGQPAEPPEPEDVPSDAETELNAQLPEHLARIEREITDLELDWRTVLAPHVRTIVRLARDSESYEDFLGRLNGAEEEFDSNPFAERLARDLITARATAAGKDA